MYTTLTKQRSHLHVKPTPGGLTLSNTAIGCLPHMVFWVLFKYALNACGSRDSILSIPCRKTNTSARARQPPEADSLLSHTSNTIQLCIIARDTPKTEAYHSVQSLYGCMDWPIRFIVVGVPKPLAWNKDTPQWAVYHYDVSGHWVPLS